MCIQLLLVCFALVALVLAAPAPQPAGNDPTVSVLRYSNDRELEELQRAIIAQYQHLGGTTQVHAPLVANVINPQSLGIRN
ncbi:hypothetical protein KR026_009166 [Drosophila bipectinata]|nr:hypothetical protein KR026_009166 [Drosophila bipectinata]